MNTPHDFLEKRLARLSSAPLSSEFIDQLEAKMLAAKSSPEGHANVIHFPNCSLDESVVRNTKPIRYQWIAVAACVLLAGVGAGFLFPIGKRVQIAKNSEMPGSQRSVAKNIPDSRISSKSQLVPCSAEIQSLNVSDEGVVWKEGQFPHRKMRVECMGNVKFVDEKSGQQVELTRPQYKTIFLPIDSQ